MKNLLIFLFGIGIGAGGTLIWLRKGIRKRIEEIESNANSKNEEPFVMNEGTPADDKNEKPTVSSQITVSDEDKAEYFKKIDETMNGPVAAEEDIPEKPRMSEIVEIDSDDFLHNHEYDKVKFVFFTDDKVMAMDNGQKIEKPFMFIGNGWEQYVGHYENRTAFVRNLKEMTDYEIYVENGAYSDEYEI